MYQIIDDLFTLEEQNIILENLMGVDSDWKFSRYFSYPTAGESSSNKKKMFGFSKLILSENKISETDAKIYTQFLNRLQTRVKFELENVFKIRAQLSLPVEEKLGNIHVDCITEFPFLVCLYYVNDSDGGTILYNELSEHSNPKQILNDSDVTERIRIDCKKGRVVVFDGRIYHAGLSPVNDYKCILNFNISMV